MKEKKKTIIGIAIAVIIIIGIVLGFFLINKEKPKTDSIKFKEEYESLNDTIRESDGQKYNNIEVPEDNPVKYVSAKEAANIIKNKSGVIYIGANWCPWCRNAIPVLLEAAKNNDTKTIYYLDLTEYRNVWEVVNGELTKSQKEKDGYYELLEALDEVLGTSTYKIKGEDGQEYDTLEKRIYMPMVIAVKGGKIADTHVGTVTLTDEQNKYSNLTKEQKTELLNIYDELIKSSIVDGKCNLDNACD